MSRDPREAEPAEPTLYLGDGVYAAWEGRRVRLWTSDGGRPQNTLWLEPEVFDALAAFWQAMTPAHEGGP